MFYTSDDDVWVNLKTLRQKGINDKSFSLYRLIRFVLQILPLNEFLDFSP